MTVTEFLSEVTEPAPGVSTPLAKLRKAYEQKVRPINRSIFASELGAAGVRLSVADPNIVFVLDRRLRQQSATSRRVPEAATA
jgi:hypothetical protein